MFSRDRLGRREIVSINKRIHRNWSVSRNNRMETKLWQSLQKCCNQSKICAIWARTCFSIKWCQVDDRPTNSSYVLDRMFCKSYLPISIFFLLVGLWFGLFFIIVVFFSITFFKIRIFQKWRYSRTCCTYCH